MEKDKADVIIADYLHKIYGFAYKKSFSHEEAEELASEMTAEVYRSLRSREEIYNVEGYIWRICEHTYSRYLSSVKRHAGISIDEMADIPYYDVLSDDDKYKEIQRLRREIAFLSFARREIVFRFYYKNEQIADIASRLNIPEGTVKWHLNKARKELKEGFTMERAIGKLGIDPVVATNYAHNGFVGTNGGPENDLADKLDLNIVYSVYYEPKDIAKIAEELGVTPVYIEDKIARLESLGYLVPAKGGRYTTYVLFYPRTYSNERYDAYRRTQMRIAKTLAEEYVPLLRKAMSEVTDVYIPGGNRDLLDAAAISMAISDHCSLNRELNIDLSKYRIKTPDGGNFIASISLKSECVDPEYVVTMNEDYTCCGSMVRESQRYDGVGSWSNDSRFDVRVGTWKNNLTEDYEYLYEYITGKLTEHPADEEKIKRLKERQFIGEDGKVQVMIVRENYRDFCNRIPPLTAELKERFAKTALETALQDAKKYPPQMQDLIVAQHSELLDSQVSMMVLDLLYGSGTLRPLTDKERVTANLIMFSDRLPE